MQPLPLFNALQILLSNSKNTLSTINTKSLPRLKLHTLHPQLLHLTLLFLQNSRRSKQQTLSNIQLNDLLKQTRRTQLFTTVL
jgi:hypothetical protein